MVKYLVEEAEADPTILSSSPPPDSPWIYEDHRRQRQEIAEYLIKGGHVEESILLGIGFPKKHLPRMEG
jgi:hypothetical protein